MIRPTLPQRQMGTWQLLTPRQAATHAAPRRATEFPPNTIQSYSIQEKWATETLLPGAPRLTESRRLTSDSQMQSVSEKAKPRAEL